MLCSTTKRSVLAASAVGGSIAFVAASTIPWEDTFGDRATELRAKTAGSLAWLPTVKAASATQVVRIGGLLNPAEIDACLLAVGRVKGKCGRTGRNADGVRVLANAPWETAYLHTDGAYKDEPDIARVVDKVIGTALRAAALGEVSPLSEKQEIIVGGGGGGGGASGPHRAGLWAAVPLVRPEALAVRLVEVHDVTEAGALPNPQHFDGGSVFTIDVMLSDPTRDFTGGRFCTLEETTECDDQHDDERAVAVAAAADGGVEVNVGGGGGGNDDGGGGGTAPPESPRPSPSSPLGGKGRLVAHRFERGDALVFLSHKRHCVTPVTGGRRRVMVIELWCGEERTCAHRCTEHWGTCRHNRAVAAAERLLASDVDPWARKICFCGYSRLMGASYS